MDQHIYMHKPVHVYLMMVMTMERRRAMKQVSADIVRGRL